MTEEHVYLSTSCLHGEHDYCKNIKSQAGPKRPAECKFCSAKCVCKCHGACPSECDPDCDAPCHENHAVPWKRHHDIKTCPGTEAANVAP